LVRPVQATASTQTTTSVAWRSGVLPGVGQVAAALLPRGERLLLYRMLMSCAPDSSARCSG
jgi:hypothetical protein